MTKKRVWLRNGSWLVLGLAFQFLAGGDQPFGPAVWLAPLFILRFFRDGRPVPAVLIALPGLAAADILANRGMMPLPSFAVLAVVMAKSAAWMLVPYLLDRLVHRFTPAGLRSLVFPSLVVAVPFLRSSQGTWLHPANALDNPIILQVASLASVAGLSFLIHWAAAAANEVWERRHHPKTARRLAAVFLGGWVLVYGFGWLRLRTAAPAPPVLRAAGIVPAPALRAKLLAAFPALLRSRPGDDGTAETLRSSWKEIFRDLLSRSTALADAGIELALWSEGAALVFEDEEKEMLQMAAAEARDHRLNLGLSVIVFQNLSRPRQPGIQKVFKNKLIFVSAEGNIVWEHAKSRPAPGMEAAVTIPGQEILSLGEAGPSRVSGAVCYEMDFPRLVRQATALRAGLFLAPANDWDEIKNMHARMSRLRAIENGMTVFRPAAGGISAAFDPYGRSLARADHSRDAAVPLLAALPAGRVSTIYGAWGNYFEWICLVVAGCGIAASVFVFLKERARRRDADGSA